VERLRKPRVDRETRESEIAEAAIRCVLRSGFHGSTMDAIAREAGVSVGVIYRYFSSKEAIIEHIVAADVAQMQMKMTGIHALGDGELVQMIIEDAGRILAEQLAPERSALRLEIYAEAARNPKVAAIVQKFAPAQREALCQLLSKTTGGVLSGAALQAQADLFRMMADGMLAFGLYEHAPNREAVVEALQRVVRVIVAPGQCGNVVAGPHATDQ
jgi:TetR/AcrR family transcriptional regulator, repressor for uid operon